MKRKFIIFLLVLSLSASIITTQAQEGLNDDDLNLLAYVETVMTDFSMLTGYYTTGQIVTDQLITVAVDDEEQTINQLLTQQLDGIFNLADNGESWESNIVLVQNIVSSIEGQPANEVDQTLDVIIVDGNFYVRISEIQPAELASLFPEGWLNLTEDPFAFPGAETLNPEQLVMSAQSPITFPLDETTVLSITELDAEQLDGDTMRRIELVVDGQALFATEAMQQQMSSFNADALGVEMDTLLALFGDGSDVTYVLWIDEDDTLRRLDGLVVSVVDMAGAVAIADSMLLTQTANTSLTFSEFNQDFEITAPEIE